MTVNNGNVQLSINGKNKKRSVAKIVAESFLPKPPEEYKYLIHIDNDVNNNCTNNLNGLQPVKIAIILGRKEEKMVPLELE